MKKPVYLGQAILDLSQIVKYEFHYDYMKPKYQENLKLCYMDTDPWFIISRLRISTLTPLKMFLRDSIRVVTFQTDLFQSV